MKHFIGIDLGTTFSVVSVFDPTGRPKVVHNEEGQNITPSCVTEIDGKYSVGEEARRTWAVASDSGEAAARFKRDMGTDKTHRINGKELTPTELSAMVLKKLAQDAVKKIGEIGEAVVTIPANFGNKAREATMDAAKMAGLNVRFIINEPTAAALYYSLYSKSEMRGVYAVYDLGGGTFDVSIIRVDGADVEVLSTNGIRHLGGDDFDRALQKIVGERYHSETGDVMNAGDYDFNDVEADKKSLSQRNKIRVKINRKLIEVTRDQFENSIAPLIEDAERVCKAAMKEANVTPSDIQAVLLAGGSTRIPMVQESVRRVFGQEPVASENVDEVVSLGAVVYAVYKGDQSELSSMQKSAVQHVRIEERTSKYYGTIALSDDDRNLFNSVLIQKGTVIPCSVAQPYYTVDDGQTEVKLNVTESGIEETDPRSVDMVWSDKLVGLPAGRPRGRQIDITFSYDENQIMHCSFVDVESGKKREVSLSMSRSSSNIANLDYKVGVE